ncbi:MAG: hypothetical protein EA378_00960 [Phycisphaerales bacterium]|nr:MAG: hypothetical protein EA378_00960 [Phycisphaerales bacterium]
MRERAHSIATPGDRFDDGPDARNPLTVSWSRLPVWAQWAFALPVAIVAAQLLRWVLRLIVGLGLAVTSAPEWLFLSAAFAIDATVVALFVFLLWSFVPRRRTRCVAIVLGTWSVLAVAFFVLMQWGAARAAAQGGDAFRPEVWRWIWSQLALVTLAWLVLAHLRRASRPEPDDRPFADHPAGSLS